MIGAVTYAAAFWWVEMRLTHKAIEGRWLRAAVAAPIPIAIALAIWSGSAPLAVGTLLVHATVVAWRLWRVWGFIDPLFAFVATAIAVGLNTLLLWLLFF